MSLSENGANNSSSSSSSGNEAEKLIGLQPPHEEDEKESEFSHVCTLCQRGFRSGKALGGHMSSAHVQAQANKDGKSLRKQQQLRRNGKLGDLGSGPDYECKLCGNSFKSKKSLFGHMRSHPERPWRGMDSPEDDGEEDEEEDQDDAQFELSDDDDAPGMVCEEDDEASPEPVVDLSKRLEKGWGETSIRGRSPIRKRGLDESVRASDMEFRLACQQLISLSNNDEHLKQDRSYRQGSEHIQRATDEPRHNYVCDVLGKSTVEQRKEATASLSNSDKAKGKRPMDDDVGKVIRKRSSLVIDEPADQHRPDGDHVKKSRPNLEKEKAMGEKYFTCSLCSKKFPSHQALGGHRSSHFKHKIVIENTIDEAVTTICGPSSVSTVVARSGDQLGEYICEICNKRFSSGQALGGHKKSHAPAVAAATADHSNPPPAPSSTTTEGSAGSEQAKPRPRPLNIDLNEMPDDDDETGLQD